MAQYSVRFKKFNQDHEADGRFGGPGTSHQPTGQPRGRPGASGGLSTKQKVGATAITTGAQLAGGYAGAIGGSALGSLIGPEGTIIGEQAGQFAGQVLGSMVGDAIGTKIGSALLGIKEKADQHSIGAGALIGSEAAGWGTWGLTRLLPGGSAIRPLFNAVQDIGPGGVGRAGLAAAHGAQAAVDAVGSFAGGLAGAKLAGGKDKERKIGPAGRAAVRAARGATLASGLAKGRNRQSLFAKHFLDKPPAAYQSGNNAGSFTSMYASAIPNIFGPKNWASIKGTPFGGYIRQRLQKIAEKMDDAAEGSGIDLKPADPMSVDLARQSIQAKQQDAMQQQQQHEVEMAQAQGGQPQGGSPFQKGPIGSIARRLFPRMAEMRDLRGRWAKEGAEDQYQAHITAHLHAQRKANAYTPGSPAHANTYQREYEPKFQEALHALKQARGPDTEGQKIIDRSNEGGPISRGIDRILRPKIKKSADEARDKNGKWTRARQRAADTAKTTFAALGGTAGLAYAGLRTVNAARAKDAHRTETARQAEEKYADEQAAHGTAMSDAEMTRAFHEREASNARMRIKAGEKMFGKTPGLEERLKLHREHLEESRRAARAAHDASRRATRNMRASAARHAARMGNLSPSSRIMDTWRGAGRIAARVVPKLFRKTKPINKAFMFPVRSPNDSPSRDALQTGGMANFHFLARMQESDRKSRQLALTRSLAQPKIENLAQAPGEDERMYQDRMQRVMAASVKNTDRLRPLLFNGGASEAGLSGQTPNKQRYQVTMKGQKWGIDAEIAKQFNTEDNLKKGLVYGWASIIEKDGKVVTDHEGDRVDIDSLTTAAHNFISKSRNGGVLHDESGHHIGHVVESVIFSHELQKALSIDLGKVGWLIGYQVVDPRVKMLLKSGLLKSFSIGGKGRREPVNE